MATDDFPAHTAIRYEVAIVCKVPPVFDCFPKQQQQQQQQQRKHLKQEEEQEQRQNDNGEEQQQQKQPPRSSAWFKSDKSMEGAPHSPVVEAMVAALQGVGCLTAVEWSSSLSADVDAQAACFIQVGAPSDVIGRTATALKIAKPTVLGLDVAFDWDERSLFVPQINGDLFSWTERYNCLCHLIHTAPRVCSAAELRHMLSASKEGPGEEPLEEDEGSFNIIPFLSSKGIVEDIFPLHDEGERKRLRSRWSFGWLAFVNQPLDDIYAYFGPKVAIHFAFLGMYTRWLVPMAAISILVHGIELSVAGAAVFSACVLLWAALLLAFWRRRNNDLVERWNMNPDNDEIHSNAIPALTLPLLGTAAAAATVAAGNQPASASASASATTASSAAPVQRTPATFQRLESLVTPGAHLRVQPSRQLRAAYWNERLGLLRRSVPLGLAVVLLQLPLEAAYYWCLWAFPKNAFVVNGAMAVYMVVVGKLMAFAAQLASQINAAATAVSPQAAAYGLVTKVFMFHFMQSYFGLLFIAVAFRAFNTVRAFLFKQFVILQVTAHVSQLLTPYIKFMANKTSEAREAAHLKKSDGDASDVRRASAARAAEAAKAMREAATRRRSAVERQYLMPSYTASVGLPSDDNDGSFDDFMAIALQFGRLTIFACVFPLGAPFALLSNLLLLRAQSFRLLTLLRRPRPHAVATIGSWLSVLQNLQVFAVVSNCVLLIVMTLARKSHAPIQAATAAAEASDTVVSTSSSSSEMGGGSSTISSRCHTFDSSVIALLVLEHLLLFFSNNTSYFVPEESAWASAKRLKQRKVSAHYARQVLKLQGRQKVEEISSLNSTPQNVIETGRT